MDNRFYVYMYLREDGSPYYIGKGCGDRWCNHNHNVEVPPEDRVKFPVKNVPEVWAYFMEMDLIDKYGRLDDGTGILENRTDGGGQSTTGYFRECKEGSNFNQKVLRTISREKN